MKKLISRPWSEAEVARMIELAASGASLLRAAGALGRNTKPVQKKAAQLGLRFAGAREIRAGMRASGALEPAEK